MRASASAPSLREREQRDATKRALRALDTCFSEDPGWQQRVVRPHWSDITKSTKKMNKTSSSESFDNNPREMAKRFPVENPSPSFSFGEQVQYWRWAYGHPPGTVPDEKTRQMLIAMTGEVSTGWQLAERLTLRSIPPRLRRACVDREVRKQLDQKTISFRHAL